MEHQHGCARCTPKFAALLPRHYMPDGRTAPRIGEGHIATRLGDDWGRWRIIVDGDDVTGDSFEAFAGNPGWVIRYARTGDGTQWCVCTCGQVCRERLTGNVVVEAR